MKVERQKGRETERQKGKTRRNVKQRGRKVEREAKKEARGDSATCVFYSRHGIKKRTAGSASRKGWAHYERRVHTSSLHVKAALMSLFGRREKH